MLETDIIYNLFQMEPLSCMTPVKLVIRKLPAQLTEAELEDCLLKDMGVEDAPRFYV